MATEYARLGAPVAVLHKRREQDCDQGNAPRRDVRDRLPDNRRHDFDQRHDAKH
jgi:hypothetical protein